VSVAALPAALYAIQNVAALTAYQNLDALTFNVLNQTKTLSAALCCYLVMGRKQSSSQVLALFLLLLSALIMEGVIKVDGILETIRGGAVSMERSSMTHTHWEAKHYTHGVAPILLASFISGLAGALSQKNLQSSSSTTTSGGGSGRNPYLFSLELCVASTLLLAASLVVSPDGERVRREGFWKGWTLPTFIPIVSNSAGGIVVGLVTKYAGSVQKGFALIFGILLSGLLQAGLQPDVGVSKEQILGGAIAALSLYLHARGSSTTPQKTTKQE
jgi:solute carrier family 35 (UDP-sugar transporter), member A1/2/3